MKKSTATATATETKTEIKEVNTMSTNTTKEVKEVKRIPNAESIKEASMNGRLQAIGKNVVGWKVTTYTDGTEEKEEINYMVHARDVLDKEEMTLFRKGIKDIVECRTKEGVKSLLTLFDIDVASCNIGQAERYLDKLFMTTCKSSNGIAFRSQTYKEDSIVPILQMAAKNDFPVSRLIRKPRECRELTKEELAFILD